MGKQSRIRGLMAGITIGFAFWGGMQRAPHSSAVLSGKETARVLAFVESEGPDTGIILEETEEEKKDRETEISLHALSAVLMDGDTGRILYEKEGNAFRSMASTTKIMTCILALEMGDPEDICTVSEKAAAQPKVRLGAGKGRNFYLKDLLYSLMLESHNDTAVMIAEKIGGSVENFSSLMNQKARALGCENTCFLTPNGLDETYTAPDGQEYVHGTTAADLALVMRYCIKESPMKDEFLKITRTADYTFADVEGKVSFSCVNHNALLSAMSGLLSGKTGFTDKAGYSYVAALEDEGRTYVIALLGSGWPPHKTYKWADARALFDYGKKRYHYRDVYREPEFPEIVVEDGIAQAEGEKTWGKTAVVKPVFQSEGQKRQLWLLLGEEEVVVPEIKLPESLKAPVKKGEQIGSVCYLLNGKKVGNYSLYADREIRKIDFSYCVCQIRDRFFSFWKTAVKFS